MITNHTKQQHANSLAAYLPSGRLFRGALVSGTNFRSFLLGLAGELATAESFLKSYQDEYDIRTTNLFIEEWESALGIPDDCFFADGDIEERRSHVLIKLASLGVQTNQDFVDLAALFGISVTIFTGPSVASFPMTFPFTFLTEQELRFVIIVRFTVTGGDTFPLTFPFIFGDPAVDIMQCLFSKLKPANVKLFFQEVV